MTNNDIVKAWDTETARSVRAGDTLGKAFRNRWAFVDVGYLIGQMLILAREHKLQNPKDILIPLIKKHIRNRDGEAEIFLEGFNIDGIEEIRDNDVVTEFSLPVKKNGIPAYKMFFNLSNGDIAIPMNGGATVYVTTELADIYNTTALIRDARHDLGNELLFITLLESHVMHSKDTTIQNIQERLKAIKNRLMDSYESIVKASEANKRIELEKNIGFFMEAAQGLLTIITSEEMVSMRKEIGRIEKKKFSRTAEEIAKTAKKFDITLQAVKLILTGLIVGDNEKKSYVSVSQLIDASIKVAFPDNMAKKVTVNISPDITDIFCFESKLFRVFLNLIRNSVVATDHAGPVSINISKQGNDLVMQLSDNGCGMSQDKVDNFNTGLPVKSSKGEEGGRGLGIVRSMIQDHGGTISVESPSTSLGTGELGKGTTFTIRLPVIEEPTQQILTKQTEGKFRYRSVDIISGGEYADRLVKKFCEYQGEVYYLCAGYDIFSLQALINMFPNASRFVLNDSFNQDETSRAIPGPKDIPGILAALCECFKTLEYGLGNFHIEIVDKKTLKITIEVESYKAKTSLKKDSIEVLYKIGDYKKETSKYGIIYVQTPGMAGRLSEPGNFYIGLLPKLEDEGVLLVSKECTSQPVISALTNVATVIANTAFNVWNPFIEPWEIYQKQLTVIEAEKVNKVLLPQSERIHATNLQDTLTCIQAQPQSQPLIVALGTSWIKGYEKGRYLQYDALNPLIGSIRTYCESKDMPFIVDDDDKLLARINTERAKEGKAGAKVVVLAGENTVKSDEFAGLRADEKNAFVVGVNNQELTTDSYIRLMEMLNLALKLSAGLEVSLDNTRITITKDNERHLYIFLPHAEPMNYEQLKAIYEVQKFA